METSITTGAAFGKGRISGGISLFLGLLSLGGVLCFLYPEALTMPELRQVYDVGLMRQILRASILASIGFGTISVILAGAFGMTRKRLGVAGIFSALVALLLGGSDVQVQGPVQSSVYLGLDYFVLTLLVLAGVFVPLERAFMLHEQKILRPGWRGDLQHFFVSHVFIQVTTFLAVAPISYALGRLLMPSFQAAVAAQPVWLQILEIMLVTDFFGYWVHRAFHKFPFLWKFHAVHHSSGKMDWLASSRTHIVDALANRGIAFAPVFWFGFAPKALALYVTFISFHAIFIHANVKWRFRGLRWLISTPEFHHWHHTSEKEAYDKNFAVFVPVFDVIFGTAYMPGRWPTAYGIEEHVPPGYIPQFLWPFRRKS